MRQRDEGWKLGPLSHCRSSLSRLGGINRDGCGGSFNQFGFMPTVNKDEESDNEDYTDDGNNNNGIKDCDSDIQADNSCQSDIVREIYIHEIQRPIHNKRRNALSQYEAAAEDSDDEQHEDKENENSIEWTYDYEESTSRM